MALRVLEEVPHDTREAGRLPDDARSRYTGRIHDHAPALADAPDLAEHDVVEVHLHRRLSGSHGVTSGEGEHVVGEALELDGLGERLTQRVLAIAVGPEGLWVI